MDGTLSLDGLAPTINVPSSPDGPCPDYDSLRGRAKRERRQVDSLFVLSPSNDPFYLSPARQDDAAWFHRLWIELGLTAGAHIRRVHYRLVSVAGTTMADGRPYENTELCWHYICNAGRDARYAGLIPAEFIVDHRNPDPLICLAIEEEKPPEIGRGIGSS